MSGGSFNYLYRQDLVPKLILLRVMVDVLREYGYEDAANRTLEVVKHMEAIELLQGELKDVWQAVEWVVSGDSLPEDLAEAVKDWKEKKGTTT